MTRIISGSAKGRSLKVPKSGTRPTSDRAREGIFSTLGSLIELEGTTFLDLYAGSGAVGLEALSRGCVRAVLVESNPQAAQVIRENAAGIGVSGASVDTRAVSSFLAGAAAQTFDVVFMDAPYEHDILGDLVALRANGWIGPDSVVAAERATRDRAFAWPEGYEAIRERKYGAGTVWYGQLAS